jgi:hypothetical protein
MITRPGLALALAVLSGCGQPQTPRQKVRFEIAPDRFGSDIIVGVKLVVHNDGPEQLCFPVRFLTADSPLMQFAMNGHRPETLSISEYSDKNNGSGPYFIASPHRVTSFPINTDALVMKSGTYSYRFMVGWFRCSDVDTSADVPMTRAETTTITGKVAFRSIYFDGYPASVRR